MRMQVAYTFSVTLKSDDTGCAQYANWWEVLSQKGELLYRRILVHSHPDTQPFTRSGGSVKLSKDDVVYVRAHMNTKGYVGDVFIGSVDKGFKKAETFTYGMFVLVLDNVVINHYNFTIT